MVKLDSQDVKPWIMYELFDVFVQHVYQKKKYMVQIFCWKILNHSPYILKFVKILYF